MYVPPSTLVDAPLPPSLPGSCHRLNNCIGSKNYRSFFLLVSTTLCVLTLQLAWGLWLIVRSFVAADEMKVSGTAEQGKGELPRWGES